MRNNARNPTTASSMLAFLLIGSAILVNLFAHSRPGSPGEGFYHELTGPKLPNTGEFDWVDNHLKQFPQTTNVFLRFEGFAPEHDYALSSFYYRAIYQRLPNRVFVSETPVVVNRGRDLLSISGAPSESWLKEHQVGAVVTVLRGADGKVRMNIDPL